MIETVKSEFKNGLCRKGSIVNAESFNMVVVTFAECECRMQPADQPQPVVLEGIEFRHGIKCNTCHKRVKLHTRPATDRDARNWLEWAEAQGVLKIEREGQFHSGTATT